MNMTNELFELYYEAMLEFEKQYDIYENMQADTTNGSLEYPAYGNFYEFYETFECTIGKDTLGQFIELFVSIKLYGRVYEDDDEIDLSDIIISASGQVYLNNVFTGEVNFSYDKGRWGVTYV